MIDAETALAAFRHHMLAGAYGDRELLMPAERDYSGMWSALCAHVSQLEDRFGFFHPVVDEVRTHMQYLADQRPNAVAIFALATTRYGREGGE